MSVEMITLKINNSISSDDPFDKPPCRGCSSYLVEPYIKCAECGPSPFLLCLQVSRWIEGLITLCLHKTYTVTVHLMCAI